ncbi:MAG: hypothetical protein AAF228_09885 [Pseudomonadota bacterium]
MRNTLKSLLFIFFIAIGISGCATPVLLSPPPKAKVGDASLTLSIQAAQKQEMPKGAQIVVSLVNMKTSTDPSNSFAIVGDQIQLTQPDRAVRITFPADRKRITPCHNKRVCAFLVQVVKNGRVLFANSAPVYYTIGQKQVTVVVENTA